MEFAHKPVMLQECLQALAIRPDGVYVDGTAGGAGHSREIAKRLTTGRLYAFDQDPDAVRVASERLAGLPAEVVPANFRTMREQLQQRGVSQVDGVLLDLGVSSFQLDNPDRGFSYLHDGALDMRMSKAGRSAADLVNSAEKQELIRILRDYGEERFAPAIAAAICRCREDKPIQTTAELAEVVSSAIPAKFRRDKNPCKRSFQAIRIAVNGELDSLREGLQAAFSLLAPGGRLAVITFHSLEDRMVKQQFAEWCRGCICPPDCPVCICGRTPQAKRVGKPMQAEQQEQQENRRSKSARLRVLEKLP